MQLTLKEAIRRSFEDDRQHTIEQIMRYGCNLKTYWLHRGILGYLDAQIREVSK